MSEQQSDLGALVRGIRTAVSPFRNTLRDLHAVHRTVDEGQVANYIPELATADPTHRRGRRSGWPAVRGR